MCTIPEKMCAARLVPLWNGIIHLTLKTSKKKILHREDTPIAANGLIGIHDKVMWIRQNKKRLFK